MTRLPATTLYRRLAASFLAVAHVLLIVAATPGSTTAAERVLFYHNDALGSPVAMTDAAGSVVWRADYEPFGGVAAEAGTVGNTHQFTGKERDPETGLQYFGARFYDAGIGRFLSVDPALLRGRPPYAVFNPNALNTYSYAANNPYRFFDPDGQFLVPLIAFAAAVIGTTATIASLPDAANAPTVDQSPQDLISRQTDSEFAAKVVIGTALGYGIGKGIVYVGGKAFGAVSRVLRFSQKTASPIFQEGGPFAGKSIGEVADGLRRGTISSSDLPIDVIVRDNVTLVVNTRSFLALQRGGVDPAKWVIRDVTGNAAAEAELTKRLLRNELTNAGTAVLRITGAGPFASSLK